MLLKVLMQYSGIISQKLSPLARRFHDIQIAILTNFVVVSNVGIKRLTVSIDTLGKFSYLFMKSYVDAILMNTLTCHYFIEDRKAIP